MNKSTKGALAIAAATSLLVGGAGTLAYWNATGTVEGDGINSGELALTNPGPQTWKLNGTTVDGSVVIVPGDHLTFAGSYEVAARGDDLLATLDLSSGTGTGGLGAFVTTDVDALIGGAAVTTVTDDNDGDTIEVRATVDFPFGSTVDNSSQNKTLQLDDMTITLTQADPNL